MKVLYTNEFNAPVYYKWRCTSTMDVAHQIATEGALHGTIVVTGKQYAGRGQYARKWHAKRGDALLCSIIIHPHEILTPAGQLQSITLRVACSVHRMLQEQLNITAHIRWPNDILIAGQKVCGILSEYRRSHNAHIVVGIGINCRQKHFPSQYETVPTSLYLSRSSNISPDALLRPLISALCYELTKIHNWKAYINRYLWRKGELVTVFPAILNQTPFSAHLIDIAEDGSLRYKRTNKTENTNTSPSSTQYVEQLYAGSVR